jgi:hypothetical protein
MSYMKSKAGRSGSANCFNTPGPTPGTNKAINYRKAIASGIPAMATPRTVNLGQTQTETGWACAPGISRKACVDHNRKRGDR